MEMGAFTGALVALLAKDMASAIASEMGKDVSVIFAGDASQVRRGAATTCGPTSVRPGQQQLTCSGPDSLRQRPAGCLTESGP